jgi:hypothetical protein
MPSSEIQIALVAAGRADKGAGGSACELRSGGPGVLRSARHPSSGLIASIVDYVPAIERAARLRALAALAGVMARPKPLALLQALREAECSDVALAKSDDELDRLSSLDQRRVLSAWTNCF